MVKQILYPLEVKEAAIRMKSEGKPIREIMTELTIRNETQVRTWWRWYNKWRNFILYN